MVKLALALTLSGGAAALTGTTVPARGLRTTILQMAAFSPDDEKHDQELADLFSSSQEDQSVTSEKKRQDQVVMSKALPFLPCPEPLIDCEFAGNVGFDPLGLANSKEQLWNYREAEMKHARLAMLAAIGWPASELWDRLIASQFNMDPMLDVTGRAPSLLNGGLGRVSPVWWGFCIGLCAAIDMYGLAKARRGDPSYQPGKLGFDPMGLYPADPRGQKAMDEAEIRNGRLAMLAVVSYTWEEWVTKLPVVQETPFFFMPLKESVELMQEAVGVEEAVEASPLLLSPLADTISHMALE